MNPVRLPDKPDLMQTGLCKVGVRNARTWLLTIIRIGSAAEQRYSRRDRAELRSEIKGLEVVRRT